MFKSFNQIFLQLVITFCLAPKVYGLAKQSLLSHDKTVVCYISTWAVYRPGPGSYSIEDFDPKLCTVAIYAFAGLDVENDGIKSLDPWQDLEDGGGKDGYRKLTRFKDTNKHLKVLLALGGWNEGSYNYSELAGHPDRRMNFVKNSLEFIQKFNFDGLDLDWEYPSQRGGKPQDKEAFVLLVRELSAEFKKHNLYLSSAFGAPKNIIDAAYDIKRLAPYLDSMHIMCYDYFGTWNGKVGFNAPLENENDLNVKFSIEYFLKMGAPADKIVMGLPFYGRTFIAKTTGDFDDETDNKGFQGPYTREDGFMGYNEICSSLKDKTQDWESNWHVESSEAIAKEPISGNGTRVVTYDSPRSIANKVRFAIKKGLQGVMVWTIDTDDFRGDCEDILNEDRFKDFRTAPNVKLQFPKLVTKKYPLMRTLNEAITLTLNEMRQEAGSGGSTDESDKDNELDSHEHNKPPATPSNGIQMIPNIVFVLVILISSLFRL